MKSQMHACTVYSSMLARAWLVNFNNVLMQQIANYEISLYKFKFSEMSNVSVSFLNACNKQLLHA